MRLVHQLLYRFRRLLFRMLFKRAFLIEPLVKFLANIRLRSHYELSHFGDDEQIDAQLDKAIDAFLDEHDTVQERTELDANIAKYIGWLRADDVSIADRETCLRARHWRTGDTSAAASVLSQYRLLYGQELEPMRNSDVFKAHNNLQKRRKFEAKAFRKSKLQLIELDPKQITPFLPFASISFIVAGYWYTSIVYRHFGIDPTQFFSVSDYVASSIEQIQHTLLGLTAYFLGMLQAWRTRYTMSYQTRLKGAQQQFKSDVLIFALSLFFLITIILEHGILSSITLDAYPSQARLAAIGVSQLPIVYVSISYFKNSQTAYALLMFLTIFFSSLYIGSQERIEEIESDDSGIRFVMDVGADRTEKESSAVIGSNSTFLFLVSDDGNVEVIPWHQIESLVLESQ